MTTEKEYFKNVMRNTVRDAVQTLLRTRRYSARFLPRKDVKSIDKEIEIIADQIITRLVDKLEAKGALDTRKTLAREEFEQMFRSTVDEYFGESSEGKIN
jgi:hypothetical protein